MISPARCAVQCAPHICQRPSGYRGPPDVFYDFHPAIFSLRLFRPIFRVCHPPLIATPGWSLALPLHLACAVGAPASTAYPRITPFRSLPDSHSQLMPPLGVACAATHPATNRPIIVPLSPSVRQISTPAPLLILPRTVSTQVMCGYP